MHYSDEKNPALRIELERKNPVIGIVSGRDSRAEKSRKNKRFELGHGEAKATAARTT